MSERLLAHIPEAAGHIPEAAGEIPEAACHIPEAAGEIPEAAGHIPEATSTACVFCWRPAELSQTLKPIRRLCEHIADEIFLPDSRGKDA